jgi:trans-L-3-hydroxyproline dehydratase
MQEPETRLTLEAPGGGVAITAECRNGKAERISVENVPSSADRLDAPLEVAGLRRAQGRHRLWRRQFRHCRCGGDRLRNEARDLAEIGIRIIAAANEPLDFSHPEAGGWDHISFCQFAGPLERQGHELRGSNACVIPPGEDRPFPDGDRLRRPHGHFERAWAHDGG